MEITLVGQVIEAEGHSDHGMIMDFSDVKTLAKQHLVDVWDHAFLVYEKDTAGRDFLASLPEHKTVVIDRIPTVENLARSGENLVIHCHAGVGRTGIFAACMAQDVLGLSADEAINWVRQSIPFAVETAYQQQFVRAYRAQ